MEEERQRQSTNNNNYTESKKEKWRLKRTKRRNNNEKLCLQERNCIRPSKVGLKQAHSPFLTKFHGVIGGNQPAPRDMQRQVSTPATTGDQQVTVCTGITARRRGTQQSSKHFALPQQATELPWATGSLVQVPRMGWGECFLYVGTVWVHATAERCRGMELRPLWRHSAAALANTSGV